MKIIDINGSEREAKEVFPDPNYPGFMKVVFRRHHEWYSIQEFLEFNPDKKNLTQAAVAVPEEIVGVVTSSGKDFLKDTGQKFEENVYQGYFVWISRGKGEAQKRAVVKNNHNTLYIDKPWDTRPNKTSQYVISRNVQDVRAFGNSLPTEDMKELEKRAREMDLKRGRINKDLKYLKPEDD